MAYDGSPNQFPGPNDAPHQTRRLDAIQVSSKPSSSWQLVRQYNLGYDYSLTADRMTCSSTCAAENIYHRLTLTSIQRIANDGTTALPATSFGYGAFSYINAGGQFWPGGSWNRLTTVNNGQGGTLTLNYANVGQVANNNLMSNQRRVTSKVVTDGRGNTYTWSYSYGTPNINSLGSTRGAQAPSSWQSSNYGTQAYPNSAALYYNAFSDVLHNNQDQLSHANQHEFRGHDWVVETDPSGAQTKHSFSQGEASDKCIPTATGGTIVSDACFQRLRDGEFQKGRETKTQVFAAGANVNTATPLQETLHTLGLAFYDYTSTPLSGLWRAFSYESQTASNTYDGSSTPLVKTTKSFYNANCNPDTTATIDASYGNIGCVQELDGTTLVRKTLRYYLATNTASSYIVDRMWGETIYDSAGRLLTLTHRFFDGAASATTAPTKGDLTLERRYYDIPNPCCSGVTLHGQDSGYGYDAYGNQTSAKTYAAAGTWSDTSGYSGPGNGSAARTTTTSYDTTFHSFPTQVTNRLSQSETGGYDYRMGTLTSVTDLNGITTSAEYDTFGRLIKLIKPNDSSALPTVLATYYDTEQPFRYRVDQREVAGQSGVRTSVQFYDGLGRKIQTKAESDDGVNAIVSVVNDTRYDGLGRVVAQSQPFYRSESSTNFGYTAPGGTLFNQTTTSYDALSRPLTITAPGSRTTTHSYGVETVGSVPRSYDEVSDPLSHRTRSRYDALGRRTQVIEYAATNATTSDSYDSLDQLTSVTDALNNSTSIDYDTLGRKTSMVDPDMGAWSYLYDANGNLTSQTDAKGQTISFSYDTLNRLTSKTMPGGWVSNYTYDETSASNKGIGHRTSISTALSGVQQTYKRWEYDARARSTLVGQSIAGVVTDLRYTYDSADRITTMQYIEAAETVSYTYDAGWRAKTLCSSIAGQACYVSGATYTALDQPNVRTTANGVLQDWDYDATTARLSQLLVSKASTIFFQRTYAYDNADNVTGITDPRWPQTQHFAYDERDRLTHAWTTATLASAPQSGPTLAQAAPETTALTSDLGALAEQQAAPEAVAVPQVSGGSGKPLFKPAQSTLAQSGTRIKDITFEGGSLIDPTTGVDSTSGTVNLETSAPLKDSYSATIPNVSSGYLDENFSGVDELFVSMYIKPASFPASARILQVRNSGTTVGEIHLTSSGTLQLKNSGTTIGTSAALSTNTLYRVGIHQKKGTGSNGVLEAYLATGDAAFGTAFATSSTQTFTSPATEIRFGATNSNAVNATFDDIRLDSGSMPDPSGGGSPTNTPTNTPTGPTATPTNTPTPTPTPSGGAPIKSITFEGGSLTDATTGVDSTAGTVNLETSAPLKGSYSATVPNNSTGNLTENFTGVDDLYVSFYIKPSSFPASARIAYIQNSGTTVGNIVLNSSGTLQLRNGSTSIGSASAALSANTLYRIGLHQRKGSGGDAVLEAFVATGDAAFGTPFASSTSESFTTQASKFVFGATNSNAVNATFDDVKLDSAAMPGPSGGANPTATPTNTPTPGGPTATPTNTPTPVPTAPPAYDISMTYNAIGNLTSKTGVGSYVYPTSGTAPRHAPSSVNGGAYTYDANGNTLTGGGRTYTWTADNMVATVGGESYSYDADGERVVRTAGNVTTMFFEGVWEQTTGGAKKLYYTFNNQVVAMRDLSVTPNVVTYLHGDHLGSVSVATDSSGTGSSTQEYDPWGAVRAGGIGATSLNYTGQRLDATGLLYYHARYYNPVVARFVSADSVVPGNASGGMAGVALKGLTVDFHEPGFAAQVDRENGQPFWFQMTDEQRQKAGNPWGPGNPQALNRYSYVRGNPIKYVDPKGHLGISNDYGYTTYHLNHEEATWLLNLVYVSADTLAAFVAGVLAGGLSIASDKIPVLLMSKFGLDLGQALILQATLQAASVAAGVEGTFLSALLAVGLTMAIADALYGYQGIDITMYPGVPAIGRPTVSRQHGYWQNGEQKCKELNAMCYIDAGTKLLGGGPTENWGD